MPPKLEPNKTDDDETKKMRRTKKGMKGIRKNSVAGDWKTSRVRERGGKLARAVNIDPLFRIQSQKRGDQSMER